jgi:nonsense-mediated mRNA decay protein 3
MPKSLARNLSNMNTLAVCSRVSNSVQLIDFNTLNSGEMSTDKFYRTPFKSIAAHDKLVEYVVLDVEPIGPVRGKVIIKLCDVIYSILTKFNCSTF